MERTSLSEKFPIGSELPMFELLNIDNSIVGSLQVAEAPAVLIVFTCNHCPYVKGSEKFLIETVERFLSKGLQVLAINSNDPTKYPEDSFENMQVKARQMELAYPYLFDETQQVAKLFDAACTPEIYLFSKQGEKQRLVYHGAINDSPRDASAVKTNYLANALDSVFAGQLPSLAYVNPLGCSIKWK